MSASRPRRTRVVLDLANRRQGAERSLVVVKIGGSLLGSSTLIDRIEWLLDQRQDSRCLIVCGGGQAVNLVRQWQQVYGFADKEAHWLALGAVTLNEALLDATLPNSTLVADAEGMSAAWERQERAILACATFVRDQEPVSAEPLPRNWDVTSDAIAAWCARQLQADELILAKSVDLDAAITAEAAAERRLVDPSFPRTLGEYTVSWTNLRAQNPALIGWL